MSHLKAIVRLLDFKFKVFSFEKIAKVKHSERYLHYLSLDDFVIVCSMNYEIELKFFI